MNYIIDTIIDDENEIVTFFLQTDGEEQIWYWSVNADDITAKSCEDKGLLGFVNNEDNASIGYSVYGFDTLEDAKADYFSP